MDSVTRGNERKEMTDENSQITFFYSLLSKYYLLLDSLEDTAALRAWYSDHAVWECCNFGSKEPEISLSVDQLQSYVEREGHLARSARLRHHITGFTVMTKSHDVSVSSAKVMVTQQPEPSRAPEIRETALVSIEWEWNSNQREWLIKRWRIQRDSI